MTLYEINQEILSCLDSETGEIIDAEKLESLMLDKESKIENIALWIKNLESESAALKAEKEAFAARQKATENKIESLKKYLVYALHGEKFSTTKCVVSFRPSETVNIPDESKLPKKYMVKTITFKPDKAAIKEAIKAGQKVKGAEIISKLNPQIK